MLWFSYLQNSNIDVLSVNDLDWYYGCSKLPCSIKFLLITSLEIDTVIEIVIAIENFCFFQSHLDISAYSRLKE